MKKTTKTVLIYIARIFADKTGSPSAARYARALFGCTAVILAFFNYSVEMVAVFLAAALGEKVATIFEKRNGNEKNTTRDSK